MAEKPIDETHGKVDPARDDDEGLRRCQEEQGGAVEEHDLGSVQAEESLADDAEDHQLQAEEQQRPPLPDESRKSASLYHVALLVGLRTGRGRAGPPRWPR